MTNEEIRKRLAGIDDEIQRLQRQRSDLKNGLTADPMKPSDAFALGAVTAVVVIAILFTYLTWPLVWMVILLMMNNGKM
jgi:Flp pilus assembly protein TadB